MTTIIRAAVALILTITAICGLTATAAADVPTTAYGNWDTGMLITFAAVEGNDPALARTLYDMTDRDFIKQAADYSIVYPACAGDLPKPEDIGVDAIKCHSYEGDMVGNIYTILIDGSVWTVTLNGMSFDQTDEFAASDAFRDFLIDLFDDRMADPPEGFEDVTDVTGR